MKGLFNQPIRIAVFGWVLFAATYVIDWVLSYLGTDTAMAGKLAAPVAILAFVCWIVAVLIGIKQLIKKENKGRAFPAVLIALIPMIFIVVFYQSSITGT